LFRWLFFLKIWIINISRAFLQLGAGLSVGLSGLAAGFAVGIVGDAGVRGTAQQPRLVD
jgi:V-type H+-transporting ATPase proteolipid subunit